MHSFGSEEIRRLICFSMTQTKYFFQFFPLSSERVIHTELSVLCGCQLCINSHVRHSAIKSHAAVQTKCLQGALHTAVGQQPSHTDRTCSCATVPEIIFHCWNTILFQRDVVSIATVSMKQFRNPDIIFTE